MKYSELQTTLQNLTNSNIKLVDIANILGITRQNLNYNINSGKNDVSEHDIHLLENHFGVTLLDDCIEVEHVFLNPSCGYGTSQEDEADRKPIKLGTSLVSDILKVSNPLMLKTFTATGDSMTPTIEHGDLILVDTGDVEYTNGGVFLITINNDWFIKRLRKKITGELDIISDNPKYPIETLDINTFKDVSIKGRILKNLSRGL